MPVITHYLIVFQLLYRNLRLLLLAFGLNAVFFFLFFYPLVQLFRLLPSHISFTEVIIYGFSPAYFEGVSEQNLPLFNLFLFVFLLVFTGHLIVNALLKGGVFALFNTGGMEIKWSDVLTPGILLFWQNLILRLLFLLSFSVLLLLFRWFFISGLESIKQITSSPFINIFLQYGLLVLLMFFSLSLWLYFKLTQASLLHHQSNGFWASCKQSFHFFRKYPLKIYSAFFYLALSLICIGFFYNLYLSDLMSQSWLKFFFFSQFLLFLVIQCLSCFEGVIFILAGTHKLESSYSITSSSKAFMRVLPKEEFEI